MPISTRPFRPHPDGEIEGVFNVARDITQRKHGEAEAAQRTAQQAAVAALGVAALEGTEAEAITRQSAENRVRHQALHDPLTGLPNRSLLLDRLNHWAARAERDRSTAAVLFVDLDNFKVINL